MEKHGTGTGDLWSCALQHMLILPAQLPGKGKRSQLLIGVETKSETGLFCGLCRSCFFSWHQLKAADAEGEDAGIWKLPAITFFFHRS